MPPVEARGILEIQETKELRGPYLIKVLKRI
jgi:hypothetical protein